jgi:hypothetical protein
MTSAPSPAIDRATALEQARRVADAVLYEGYVLYPYRASGQKNRLRWQFGVLVPRTVADGLSEQWDMATECLVESRSDLCTVSVQVRFLQIQARTVERADNAGSGRFVPTEALELPDRRIVPWEEGVAEQAGASIPLDRLLSGEQVVDFEVDGGQDVEEVREAGAVVGRLVRRRLPLTGRLRLSAERTPGPYGAIRLHAVVENVTPWPSGTADADPPDRPQAMRRSMVGTHAILTVSDGGFLSLLDPPEWARPATTACTNRNAWPVLVGNGRNDVMLASPIILYDFPQIAPESTGELYDSTEIEEILNLRTLALTDEEKREARGTDPRAEAVIDRVDDLPPEVLDRLHGAIRYLRETTSPGADFPTLDLPDAPTPDPAPWWNPEADSSVSPESDLIEVRGVLVGKGSQVYLRPGVRRSDAQDLFLDGRLATVQAVLRDVDEGDHLAVTIDGDPAAELQQAQGRFRYFRPDEVEPTEVRP